MNKNENDTMSGRLTMGGVGAGGRPEWTGTMSGRTTADGEEGVVLAGRYRVVRRLGEGGMGSVWLAEDLKLDGKLFAVKMLPSVLAGNKGAYRQVKAEALMAMKLAHPNIAIVRAFEEDEGGNPFLVMDYIEGEGLDDILAERGLLGEEEARKILGPVAAALDYAHSKGVVHRDVKPGNVMVEKDGTPYVLDFGIAREVQETLTRVTGKLSSGTLLYMSPEQLNGRSPKAAQDVYSFAAMTYECLTGNPPFSRGQIEWQIVNNPPEPLPESVGEELRAGVMAGLAKEPEKRPGSCAAVMGRHGLATGDLEKANHEKRGAGHEKGGGGRTARPEGSPRQQRGAGKRWWWVLAALVAAGVGLSLWQWQGREAGGKSAPRQDIAGEPLAPPGEETAERLKEEAEGQMKPSILPKATLDGRDVAVLDEVEEHAAGTVKTITLPGGAKMEMVWCPAGRFMMGSNDGFDNERPVHEVTLTKGFWMCKTEVTQAQWTSVMGTNPSHFRGNNQPVEKVSWNDCQEFCRRCREAGVDLRLPTEAQWEYACRAGSTEPYAGSGNLDDMGWYLNNSGGQTHPVGQKQPNAWGLYDMHGNVSEWCADWYEAYPGGEMTNPTGPSSGSNRVLRGGGWAVNASYCSSSYRTFCLPSYEYGSCDYGFRLVRTLSP